MNKIQPVTLESQQDELRREIDRLMLKVADLQAENQMLRRRLPKSTKDMKRLRQAYRDSQALLVHRFSGFSISRANCLELGIPCRRWVWAVGLLKLARIHNGIDVIEDDFQAANAALDVAYKGLENAGNIDRLRLRVPPSATNKLVT